MGKYKTKQKQPMAQHKYITVNLEVVISLVAASTAKFTTTF